MEKDFDRWNKLKKAINASDESERVYFHEGDIWWARVGVNIGYEIDGKHKQFARPVIVLKKYNQYSFLALPLTTAQKRNPYRLPIGMVQWQAGLRDTLAATQHRQQAPRQEDHARGGGRAGGHKERS